MKNLIQEIHRRSLWQVLGIYLVGSFVALQVVEQVAEAAGLPAWVRPLALILLVIGFPIVMATAFVQEGLSTKRHESPEQSLAEVGEVAPGPPLAPSGAASFLTWKNATMGGIGALTVWGLVALVWVIRGGGQVAGTGPAGVPGGPASLQARVTAIADRANQDLPTIAVLPFEDSGSEDEYAFFADGVHTDLLTNLSKIESLIVLARATVMRYRGSELSVQEVADELNATSIVSGSVRRVGTDVRINVELVDPATNASLWSERYDRSLDDIFAVQSEIAREVANALRANLSADEEARLAAVPTGDLTAYDIYTRARQAYLEYAPEPNARAIELFKGAIERDPNYGLAWAGLGDAYAQNVSRWGAAIEWGDSAVAAANRAVELIPESSEAHKALGLALTQLGRIDESLASYERALELNPSNSSVANNLASRYVESGRPADAIPLFKLSARLNPYMLARTNMGIWFAMMEFPELARDQAALDREFSGENTRNLNVLIFAAMSEGDYSTALALQARALEIDPDDPLPAPGWTRALYAYLALNAGELDLAEQYAQTALESANQGAFRVKNANTVLGQVALARGDTTSARRYLRNSLAQQQELEDRGADNMWQHLQHSVISAALGETEDAIESAITAVQRGAIYPLLWDPDPAFDGIREDPRFQAMRADVQERFEAERAKIEAQEGRPSRSGG